MSLNPCPLKERSVRGRGGGWAQRLWLGGSSAMDPGSGISSLREAKVGPDPTAVVKQLQSGCHGAGTEIYERGWGKGKYKFQVSREEEWGGGSSSGIAPVPSQNSGSGR